jgi:hypothetical protein
MVALAARPSQSDAAGANKITFYILRHPFASRLVMAGMDILTVRDLGGEKGGLAMVGEGTPTSRQATGGRRSRPLAPGVRLQRSGTQSGNLGDAPHEGRFRARMGSRFGGQMGDRVSSH